MNDLIKGIKQMKHTHDCDRCIFLESVEEVDYYVCPDSSIDRRGSVIARYSGDGPDYQSIPVVVIEYTNSIIPEDMMRAYELANRLGHIKQKP